jgi:hypothetical protein
MRSLLTSLPVVLMAAVIGLGSPQNKDVPGGPPITVVEVPSQMAAGWQEVAVPVAGKAVKIKTKDDKPAEWFLIDDGKADITPLLDGKQLQFVAQEPGVYRVIAYTAGNDLGRIKFVVGGVNPNPLPDPDDEGKPKPKPKPKPDPDDPADAAKSFVVVEDSAKPGTFRGDILGSKKVQALYKAAGLTHRLIDVNAPADSLDEYAKKYLALAKGHDLPFLVTIDKAGKAIWEGPCPKTDTDFAAKLEGTPHPRAMGYIPADKLRLKWTAFGDAPNVPLVPEADWKPVDYSNFLPDVYDQDGRGQCASSSACTLVEASYWMAGLSCPKLSAGDLYSRVNGGRDQGSMLEDNMEELLTNGVATAATVPYVWDGRRHDTAAVKAERAKRKVVEVYVCPTFEATVSALQQGFLCQVGLMWYNNYNPGSDGWLPSRGTGRPGGHALMAYGCAKNPRTGEWGLLIRNSWNAKWGIGGNCIIPKSDFGRDIGGFWAVRAVRQADAVSRLNQLRFDANHPDFALAR